MNGVANFAQQRLVAIALVIGMTIYAVAVAIVLQQNDGKGLSDSPIELLDTVVLVVGGSTAVAAFALRSMLRRAAEQADAATRVGRRFAAMLVPLAMIEGGCLFALTVWMLNGNAVPTLVVALVLLTLAIVMVPFSDPDSPR